LKKKSPEKTNKAPKLFAARPEVQPQNFLPFGQKYNPKLFAARPEVQPKTFCRSARSIDKIYIRIYTIAEVINMTTAKIFTNGKSQAVRLPKEYRFSASEVLVQKVGYSLLLTPKERAQENFLNSEPLSNDVYEAILQDREKNIPDAPREDL
jgi:antitoxin VapB